MSKKTSPFSILLEIDQRCRRFAAGLPLQQDTIQMWSGIGFRLGEHLFVASMGEISEVLHEQRYTLLPGVKNWVKGVANVRGRLLPIMDLCGFFGGELSSVRKLRRILVVDYQNVFVGLTVDEVFGMQHFPVDTFSEDVPPLETNIQPFVQGVFQRERKSWLVFSPGALAQDSGFLDVAY